MQIEKAIQKTSQLHHDEIRTRLSTKLHRLHTINNNRKTMAAQPDRRLTTTEVHLLERGLNFNTNDATAVDFIAALESITYNLYPLNKERKNL